MTGKGQGRKAGSRAWSREWMGQADPVCPVQARIHAYKTDSKSWSSWVDSRILSENNPDSEACLLLPTLRAGYPEESCVPLTSATVDNMKMCALCSVHMPGPQL